MLLEMTVQYAFGRNILMAIVNHTAFVNGKILFLKNQLYIN